MNATYMQALVVMAIVCFLAVIVLMVPTILDAWRRWREAGRTHRALHGHETATELSEANRRLQRFSNADHTPQDALGWSTEEEGDETEGSGRNSVAQGGEKTILIADDDPVVVLALSRRLQALGYTVLRSPDAVHALLGAIKSRPDLVILDVNMPSGNGLAVCEMMASDPHYAGIPVIIHSVIADDTTKQRCQQLGVHHVEKSSRSWSEIRSLVERFLGPSNAVGKPPVANTSADAPRARKPQPASEPASSPAVVTGEERPAGRAPTAASASPVCGRSRMLCIESPQDRLELVDHQLSALGMDVIRTSDLDEGFWTCFTEKPHVVLVHAAATEKKVARLLLSLATHPITRNLPVLWINEGNGIAPDPFPETANLKVLKHPMDWEELLGTLEELLPMFARHDHDPLARPTGTDAEPQTVCEAKPLKVLCIDDDPLVARSVAMRLQPYGIEVKSADNGTGGYLLAAAETPDLILLDLQMPNGEGNYILGKLKDNPSTETIPVIVLTMETSPGVQRQLLSLGADAFVSKPVSWRDLFAEMGRCVPLPSKLLLDYNVSEQLTGTHS